MGLSDGHVTLPEYTYLSYGLLQSHTSNFNIIVLDICMVGTVIQCFFFYIGPSIYFMKCRKML